MRISSANPGVTLLELVLAMSIVGIIAGVSVPLLVTGVSTYVSINDRGRLMETGRLTLERLRREFGQLKDSTSVLAAGSSQLQIVDSNDDTLTYTLSSGSLTRKKNGGSAHTLAENVNTNPSYFRFYTKAGDTLSAPALTEEQRLTIWSIQIHLRLSKGTDEMVFDSKFFPETLKARIYWRALPVSGV